jgi:hypothetical protein
MPIAASIFLPVLSLDLRAVLYGGFLQGPKSGLILLADASQRHGNGQRGFGPPFLGVTFCKVGSVEKSSTLLTPA